MATSGFGPTQAVGDPSKPELVFGLIGALGANIANTETSLRGRLVQLGYSVAETIKLSELLRDLKGPRFEALRVEPGRAHVSLYMDAGNELRSVTGRGEAVALLGVNGLRSIRRSIGFPAGKTANAHAFILNSLKHPAEVGALREIYGPAFVAVPFSTSAPSE